MAVGETRIESVPSVQELAAESARATAARERHDHVPQSSQARSTGRSMQRAEACRNGCFMRGST